MDLNEARDSCDNKIRKYNRLLRRYDPSKVAPGTVKLNHNKWEDEISAALDTVVDSIESMVLKHRTSLGSEATTEWNSRITKSEDAFRSFSDSVTDILSGISAPPLAAQPSNALSSDLVNVTGKIKAEAEIKVEDDIITKEGKKLEEEVEKVENWEEATNEEIEEAMSMTEGWKKRLSKLENRISTVKLNVLTYKLSDVRQKALEAFVSVIEKKMEDAIKDIKKQDGKRGLYSMSK